MRITHSSFGSAMYNGVQSASFFLCNKVSAVALILLSLPTGGNARRWMDHEKCYEDTGLSISNMCFGQPSVFRPPDVNAAALNTAFLKLSLLAICSGLVVIKALSCCCSTYKTYHSNKRRVRKLEEDLAASQRARQHEQAAIRAEADVASRKAKREADDELEGMQREAQAELIKLRAEVARLRIINRTGDGDMLGELRAIATDEGFYATGVEERVEELEAEVAELKGVIRMLKKKNLMSKGAQLPEKDSFTMVND